MIVNLSYPIGHSVNAGISEELASVKYARVDNAVHMGRGTQLIKVDLKSAYWQVPIPPGSPFDGDFMVRRDLCR